MKRKLNCEDWIHEAMHSLDPQEKQDAPPYLLTRLRAKLRAEEEIGFWGKFILVFSKPSTVLSILLVILAVNGFIIISNYNKEKQAAPVTTNNHYRDDFSSTLVSVYDYENLEP